MNTINVGDFVIVRSNNSVNREVGKVKKFILQLVIEIKLKMAQILFVLLHHVQ
jgi:hypothetical protein